MLKLKFQYFGHLMQRADSLEKILILGKTEGKRRMEWQQEASYEYQLRTQGLLCHLGPLMPY